jgi:glutamate-ammonia-ligase adenylyltransferase
MGKFGGRELNAGSDIDLMLFYETDDGATEGSDTLHEYFTRLAQRFISTLDAATEDGVVWRVDMRLRPEGSQGPLVSALAAAERYYELWGRTWERAALVRARAVAGDIGFGERLLGTLSPFVWRRAVDPRIADEMVAMLARARAEASASVRDDLKIGPGGIREVEFFAQTLQLIWGGREPRLRCTNTIDALRRLRAAGFVSEREEAELADGYLFLRRLEHRIQFATGLPTHAIPSDAQIRERVARSLGYQGASELSQSLAAVRARVGQRFSSLGHPREETNRAIERIWSALDSFDEAAIAGALLPYFGVGAAADLPRYLITLARPPDRPFGAPTRDRDPELARRLLEALSDAADPEQAARLLSTFFSRLATPGIYLRALGADPRLVRSLCSLLGGSLFLGEELVGHPDLADHIVYARGVPTPEVARAQVDEEVGVLAPDGLLDIDAFVGALRRAKRRVTFETGLADLAGDLDAPELGAILTALADATLQHACRFAMREKGRSNVQGLSLIAMGKLGGCEIGYGSDLDLLFVYEDEADDALERFARVAQRVLRIVGAPHDEGTGYELDTRLRPSGTHGLLVVSLGAFARYQQQHAEAWERQALIKARACAGDLDLGARVIEIAQTAAYERGAPSPEDLHRMRKRMETELAHERRPPVRSAAGDVDEDPQPARYDLKVGRGGLVDVEFAVQWLQMRHGRDARIRTTETEVALNALETCGYVDLASARTLRDGWHFLRALERRLRIAHGTAATLLEQGAPGLPVLARRMGIRGGSRSLPEDVLLARYEAATSAVRQVYLSVLGL